MVAEGPVRVIEIKGFARVRTACAKWGTSSVVVKDADVARVLSPVLAGGPDEAAARLLAEPDGVHRAELPDGGAFGSSAGTPMFGGCSPILGWPSTSACHAAGTGVSNCRRPWRRIC
jgi:hypothetical protein